MEKTLCLRDYNAQISETYAIIKTLNKLTELGILKTKPLEYGVSYFGSLVDAQIMRA
ncbi:hypothetical protein BTN50_0610 [Candidatus Enterovibrio altilux]|uniref:Mobile element protein n=1 Tax=Candidatus Enterovibrio altilux TaxID=1927128 RepID=A0A291B800_9GAMM|nr:hypothetical protein BTN50_0610 [Candidatus Enterovibrio luxaltus]